MSSESSDSVSESSTEESASESSASEDPSPPQRTSKGVRKARDRGTVRVKEEVPDDRKVIKEIQSRLAAIKVQLADNQKPWRAVTAIRNNVWCTRCGRQGHYLNECPNLPAGTVQFVDVEGTAHFATMDY